MKKPTAILLALSCAFILPACNPPKDDLKSYKPNVESLDQLRQVITWTNTYGEGFRIDLDPSTNDWIKKFIGTPGRIDEVESGAFDFKLKIDGRDWRTFIPKPKFDTSTLSDPHTRYLFSAACYGEKDNVRVIINLPYYNNLRITIQNNGESVLPVDFKPPSLNSVPGGSTKTPVELTTQFLFDSKNDSLPPGQSISIDISDSWLAQADLLHDEITSAVRLTGPKEDVNTINGLWNRLNLATSSRNYPLGPFGATSNRFNGHVFWDADIWWFPALALTNPQAAAQIPTFRYKTLDQARKNAQEWAFQDSRPVGNSNELGKVPSGPQYDTPNPGAKYPWESNPNGEESSPTETRYQDHLSASVAHMVQQSLALGLDRTAQIQKPDFWKTIIDETRDFYQLRRQGDELHQTVSPSEWHTVNNDLYTNALLEVVYGFDMKLPRDETTFLTFDNDKLKLYQQAAALLAVYPLQHPEVEAEADLMLKRYKDKAAKEGPAMSHSINAIIAARLGQTELAYDEWQKSWRNYTDDPWLNFREKPKYGDSFFYTGAAGCLNAVYYGFMGLRLDRTKPKPGKPWQIPLKNGWWLSAEPHLPKEWTRLELDIIVLEKPYTLVATHQGLSVKDR